jgi:predicted pyridoxine 5'-phosphate oxidase superfamily flavin-nucleotide-binding protein
MGGVGRTYKRIDERLASFLEAQPVFFVATAPLAGDGMINCSPKGNRDELRVIGERTLAYLDQTGSGAETLAHLRENGRIVVMFCAFEGSPRIVRVHGQGRFVHRDAPEFAALAGHFPRADGVGVRSVVVVDVERVSDSCGYGVPLMSLEEHRSTMDSWSSRKGDEGIRAYWVEKNLSSIDGLPALDFSSDSGD